MVTGGQRGRPEGAHLLLPHAPCCCSWRCCCELVLFTSSLLTRGEREREEGEEGGEGRRRRGGGLAQRRCPVSLSLDYNKHESGWEKRAQGRSPPAPARPPRSLSASLLSLSPSSSPPRRSAMSLSGAQTPEDGLYGECCCWWRWWWCSRHQAAVASDLFCLPSQPWRRCFSFGLTCSC